MDFLLALVFTLKIVSMPKTTLFVFFILAMWMFRGFLKAKSFEFRCFSVMPPPIQVFLEVAM